MKPYKPASLVSTLLQRASAGDEAAYQQLTASAADEVWVWCTKHLSSKSVDERLLAARMLGNFGLPNEPVRVSESVDLLLSALDKESDDAVKGELISALGSRSEERALQTVIKFKSDPSAEVRRRVASNLPFLWDMPLEHIAISTLVELARDEVPDVRNWAVFALGEQMSTYEVDERSELLIRKTLQNALLDDDPSVGKEAQDGLRAWMRNWENRT